MYSSRNDSQTDGVWSPNNFLFYFFQVSSAKSNWYNMTRAFKAAYHLKAQTTKIMCRTKLDRFVSTSIEPWPDNYKTISRKCQKLPMCRFSWDFSTFECKTQLVKAACNIHTSISSESPDHEGHVEHKIRSICGDFDRTLAQTPQLRDRGSTYMHTCIHAYIHTYMPTVRTNIPQNIHT